jgi:aspartate/methionine/tyrosine aminotransferase
MVSPLAAQLAALEALRGPERTRISEQIERLKARDRRLVEAHRRDEGIVLGWADGLTIRQIALVLGETTPWVAQRIHRLREAGVAIPPRLDEPRHTPRGAAVA